MAFMNLAMAKKNSTQETEDPHVVRSETGLKIPSYGLAIDAYYSSDLDRIIPGYRILNVVIQNNQNSQIDLDVVKDKWFVVDHMGKKHKAFNHITQFKKSLWDKMSEEAKNKLKYPSTVPPGKLVAVDLFFNDSVELHNFQELHWDSDFLQKEFAIYSNFQSEIKIDYSTSKVLDFPEDPNASNPELIQQQNEYMKARDQYISNHEKDVKKIFYMQPDGSMKEVNQDEVKNIIDFNPPENNQ